MIRFGVKKSGPLRTVIVPDQDLHIFSISHPHHLPLIATPLATAEDIYHGKHSHPDDTLHEEHAPASASISHENRTDSNDSTQGGSEAGESARGPIRPRHPDEPVLKRAHEASTIQLFFDLFFVANLTTFSTVHEVDTWAALESYLGYFAIIWFTWFQNTLFDVRFSNDSVFERVCKVLQFGIMTGFAVTGPGYITGVSPGTDSADKAISASITAFKSLSLILMSSRLILTFQYSVAFFWIRSYKKAWYPMLAHIVVLFTSAMIFLGLFFAFQNSNSEKVLAGWYVVVALEALIILMISGNVHFLSFRKTVLVERLGLLTLIILGEGIIDMCTSINNVGSDNVYSADIIGMIICSVATIYSMWMLYFDQIQEERMGTLRQHIWAVIHFPFHVSILLVVEGLSRLSVWRKVLDVVRPLQIAIANFKTNETNVNAQLVALNGTVQDLIDSFNPNTRPSPPSTGVFFQSAQANSGNSTEVLADIAAIYNTCFSWACTNFKITLDADTISKDATAEEQATAIFALFRVVFVYLFLFAGLNLIFLGILFLLGKRRKLRGELLTVGVRWFFGLGLSLLALIAADKLGSHDGNDALHHFIYSPWMLPTVLITYLTVIVLDNILIRYVKEVAHFRLRFDFHGHMIHKKENANEAALPKKSPVPSST